MECEAVAHCKYCNELIKDIVAEALECEICNGNVHIKCLKRGSVPGGLVGDIFFDYTCLECSQTGTEIFKRQKISWFQTIILALFHITNKKPGLSRRGYFHWRIHLSAFIDSEWENLLGKDVKRRKNWFGTVSGNLSSQSPHFITSGASLFTEGGWWALTFQNVTPNVIFQINQELIDKKIKTKGADPNYLLESVKRLLIERGLSDEYLKTILEGSYSEKPEIKIECKREFDSEKPEIKIECKRELDSEGQDEGSSKKMIKLDNPSKKRVDSPKIESSSSESSKTIEISMNLEKHIEIKNVLNKFMDPMCHYNTSLNDNIQLKGLQLKAKLLGNLREEVILSPYSLLYLRPYIRRDIKSFPIWLKLMAELQLKVNKSDSNYILPARSSIDYVYLQPSHIPAVNSLCNHFFWPGIDLTDCLQYPDFTCVVLYKKLIIGFALLVPNVKVHENYISFIFVRPGWRNIGIGRFMIYHLIQTSIGKDITLHVSISNSALFLYQKFGFKVEHVELDFYDKYYRNDSRESKHAFFCRLER